MLCDAFSCELSSVRFWIQNTWTHIKLSFNPLILTDKSFLIDSSYRNQSYIIFWNKSGSFRRIWDIVPSLILHMSAFKRICDFSSKEIKCSNVIFCRGYSSNGASWYYSRHGLTPADAAWGSYRHSTLFCLSLWSKHQYSLLFSLQNYTYLGKGHLERKKAEWNKV